MKPHEIDAGGECMTFCGSIRKPLDSRCGTVPAWVRETLAVCPWVDRSTAECAGVGQLAVGCVDREKPAAGAVFARKMAFAKSFGRKNCSHGTGPFRSARFAHRAKSTSRNRRALGPVARGSWDRAEALASNSLPAGRSQPKRVTSM